MRRCTWGPALLVSALLTACVPQLPDGYHADSATGERTANSEDQVKKGVQQLARTTPKTDVLATELPPELLKVPVPENAIARRYERKQRTKNLCEVWLAISGSLLLTPSLDDPEDLRKDAQVVYLAVHGLDPDKRYPDASIRVKRGGTTKRRLPAEVKAALPELEEVLHAWFARMLYVEELADSGKLTPSQQHALVQRALTEVTGPQATALVRTVNDFYIVHCLGGTA